MTVRDNLASIHERIEAACRAAGRDPSEVTLVAVSKRQPDERLAEAYDAGHRDFGENFVQELERKQALFPDARWHLIGHVQSNKASRAATASLIHTVDSEKLLKRLAAAGAKDVLVQVNVDGEATKSGVLPAEAERIVRAGLETDGANPVGLMCIPAPGAGRAAFAQLARLRDEIADAVEHPLPHLSMGMSGDFEDAIREGATIVRVGTAIFGTRLH